MSSNSNKSKRIAKNTCVLYVRMLLLMAITLYTSRVILHSLGVNDFGIYNVVGGFVSTFAIVCSTLSGACSRFFNYEMGKGRKDRLSIVFSSAVTIHVALAVIIAILAETFGTWFLNNKLTIPADRMVAANWCFQLSVITFCTNLVIVPYRAAIISHEKMKAFAYVSIYEGIAKLLISFLITFSPIDRLVFYAILLCLLQFSTRPMYSIYCHRHFEECHYHFVYDKKVLKDILSYSGWNFFGHASGVLRNQGGNVLTNIFFGPTVNAARGIANQVLGAVNGFVTNFTTAVNPQISQSYASGELEYMRKLVYTSARFSFYMLFFLSLPIILSSDYIIEIWLKEPPEHAGLFVRLILIYTLINSVNSPIQQAQLATGNIKIFQLVSGLFQLTILPISYVILRNGGSPATVLYVSIVVALLSIYLKQYLLQRILPWDVWDFSKKVLFKVALVTIVTIPIPLITSYMIHGSSMLRFIITSFASLVSTIASIWLIGLAGNEKEFMIKKLNNFKNKLS